MYSTSDGDHVQRQMKPHSWKEEAATDSKKALELSPDVFPDPIQLRQIYVMQGRPQDALTEIELVRDDAYRAFLYAIA